MDTTLPHKLLHQFDYVPENEDSTSAFSNRCDTDTPMGRIIDLPHARRKASPIENVRLCRKMDGDEKKVEFISGLQLHELLY